ncbi:MAG: hypothetical protein ACQEXJ_24370 [Myxococcota bacterium]
MTTDATQAAGGASGKAAGSGGYEAQTARLSPDNQPGYESQAGALSPGEHAGPAPQVEGAKDEGGPLSEKRAAAVLNAAFEDYKTISAGKLELLDTDDFKAAYDAIYGDTKYSWDEWVAPVHGGLNGFAHDGVNYIHKASANAGTVPHEMLHNNTASDFTPFVGSQFNEGATDVLKQHALKKAGIRSPNSYPNQIACVEKWLDSGRTKDDLFTAYLKGGAAKIVGEHVDDTCKGSWAEVKSAMENKDWARAKVKLRKKS